MLSHSRSSAAGLRHKAQQSRSVQACIAPEPSYHIQSLIRVGDLARACVDDLIGQLCRTREHDFVTTVHFKQFENSKTRRHTRMKIAEREGFVLSAVDEALGNGQ